MSADRDIKEVSTAFADIGWEVIHTYTRAQAIADGVLVDVSRVARQAGIKYPVALTAAVHANYVRVLEGAAGQDELGRLWDILWMFRFAVGNGHGDRRAFSLYVLNHPGEVGPDDLVRLIAHCGPGDEAEPVITIMLPSED